MERLTKGWVHHLRKTARQETAGRGCCPLCDAEIQPDIDSFRAHVRADAGAHASLADDADIEQAFQNVTIHGSLNNHSASARPADATRPPRKRPVPGHLPGADRPDGPDRLADALDRGQRGSKRICSPPASVAQPERGSSPPTPGRSRARLDEAFGDYDRAHAPKNAAGRQLWSPDDASRPRTPLARTTQFAALGGHARRPPQTRSQRPPPPPPSQQQHQQQQQQQQKQQQQDRAPMRSASPETAWETNMIREPATKPISHEQLVAEVKGIYAGLVMIETKCIEYDSSQEANKLSKEQYHALVALHRSVLHEHHDFFLASQHPSATDALRRLASKYAMPARMWRHGIHSFLELLRHKLPESLEHMLTFIYIAYSMMALLYETVPAFEDTWIECLGDLGRYRMAIEDDDIRDREIWTGVSRYWYSKASDKSPTTGRLYHHLAILARPNALQQLYYYNKSLCVPIPFASARESVMTLFDPLLGPTPHQRLEPVDAAFVRVHGILFTGKAKELLEPSMAEFLDLLDGRIGSARSSWLEAGYYVGISLSCSLLGFGDGKNVLMRAMSAQAGGQDAGTGSESGGSDAEACAGEAFRQALYFAARTYETVLRRWGDKNTLSCLHTAMVFLLHVSRYPAAMCHIEEQYPWKLTSMMLNYLLKNLLKTIKSEPRIDTDEFPGPEKEGEPPYPLPEDYALRGLVYAEDYFPVGWFDNDRIDESDRYLELPSKAVERQERILWIGRRLASSGRWLTWDDEARQFSVAAAYDVVLRDLPDHDDGADVDVSEPEDFELS